MKFNNGSNPDVVLASGKSSYDKLKKIIKIDKEIKYSEGERYISIQPSTLSLNIDFELKYKNQVIGNQKSAIDSFKNALNIKPSYANASFNMGNSYKNMHEYKCAIEYYKKTIYIRSYLNFISILND